MANSEQYEKHKKNDNRKIKGHFPSLFFFYIIPFILINLAIFYIATALPKANISISEPIAANTVEITIVKKSLFPSKSITAKFEDEELELRQISSNVYFATVNKNGTFELNITNLNGMSKTFYEYVGSIDDTPPTIDGIADDKTVTVNFSDDGSGIDYTSIYALDFYGDKLSAIEIDKENNTATFSYNGFALEVHVADNAGNEVTASFSDRVE